MNKHLLFLLFALLALVSQAASAQTIRRVNNTSGVTGTNIYTTIQDAHNAAVDGDIIQLEPSTVSYGNLTCTKRLRIVGPGYFLGANQPPPLQATTQAAIVGYVYFNTVGTASSSNSSISGVTATGIDINTSTVTVQRNLVIGAIRIGPGTLLTSNALVRQNYAETISSHPNAGTGLVIANNIITSSVDLSYGNGEFTNNAAVTYLSSYYNNFILRNNYFNDNNSSNGINTTVNTSMSYNLFQHATLPPLGSAPSATNTANVAPSNVFILGPGTTPFDAWYQLKSGTNPARGTGLSGADIGAFSAYGGTTNTYRLSGIPPIPSIYQIDQQTVGNSLNLTIGTRSNN